MKLIPDRLSVTAGSKLERSRFTGLEIQRGADRFGSWAWVCVMSTTFGLGVDDYVGGDARRSGPSLRLHVVSGSAFQQRRGIVVEPGESGAARPVRTGCMYRSARRPGSVCRTFARRRVQERRWWPYLDLRQRGLDHAERVQPGRRSIGTRNRVCRRPAWRSVPHCGWRCIVGIGEPGSGYLRHPRVGGRQRRPCDTVFGNPQGRPYVPY